MRGRVACRHSAQLVVDCDFPYYTATGGTQIACSATDTGCGFGNGGVQILRLIKWHREIVACADD